MSDADQLPLPFDVSDATPESIATWTPRDIWVKLNQRSLELFREDRRIEFKGGMKINFDDLATYYSAFSNTPDGGVIVIGVNDDGKITGCQGLTADVLNRLHNFHVALCPQARPEFKQVHLNFPTGPGFCEAIYLPYVSKLVETNKDEAWIRYGDTRSKMSDDEKRDFRATRQQLSFEMEAAPYKFPEEFDAKIISDFCLAFRQREGRRDWNDEEILTDRNLVRIEDNALIVTNALVLLAAKNPRKSIPGSRVRVQRFPSDQEGYGTGYNPIKDKFIEGNLVEIITKASAIIKDTIFDVTWLNRDGKFVTTPEYPEWAWFEALVNASVHRSYSYSGSEITVKFFPNRLIIESPGSFVPPVNERTIYHVRATRNSNLMDALRYLGYVQMAREGTRRIKESMKEYGLPEPVFRQEALHGVVVRVTLRNDHESRKRTTDRDVANHFGVDIWKTLQEHEVKIVAYAFNNKKIQVSEAQRVTERTWGTSKKDLDRLCRKGILQYIAGDYPRDPKAHYTIKSKEE